MEKLSISTNNVIHQGNWDPIHLSPNGPQLSHLLFADDVLLFTNAKNSQLHFIANMFESFSQALGLKINLAKYRAFFSIGTAREKLIVSLPFMVLKASTLLTNILAFLFSREGLNEVISILLLKKKQCILAFWKHKMLNKTGRVTLASSVLSSIPSYYMHVTWLP